MAAPFEKSKKTFLGYLQARGKALNTVKNYACDLSELGGFCARNGLDYLKLGLNDLEAFHAELKARGLSPNSRRRKIVTAKTFLRYLSGRLDIATVGAEKIIPPDKVEQPPRLVPREVVESLIDAQPNTDIGWRNRALIGVLVDTGMLVSEALALRLQDCRPSSEGAILTVVGKRARTCLVSKRTADAIAEVGARLQQPKFLFYGYNRSGPLPERLTSRGVEVLFKSWAQSLGIAHFYPRTLRHLFVVECLLSGRTEAEVMMALALRTPYAFRVYRQLVDQVRAKSSAAATCIAGKDQEPVAGHPE